MLMYMMSKSVKKKIGMTPSGASKVFHLTLYGPSVGGCVKYYMLMMKSGEMIAIKKTRSIKRLKSLKGFG